MATAPLALSAVCVLTVAQLIAQNPRLIADTVPGVALRIGPGTVVVDRYVFLGDGGLWVTDGTASGTSRIHSFVSLFPVRPSLPPIALGGRAVFGGDDGAAGSELWISDGSAAGTVMIADIVPGAAASDPNSFTRVGERVYFLARTSTWQLWSTDGTTAGTGRVPGFPTIAVAPATMVAAGGTCVTYVDPASLAIAYLFPSIAPTWSWTLPLPNAPLLRGITVAAQAWYGPSGNPAGFEVSNGVYLTLDY